MSEIANGGAGVRRVFRRRSGVQPARGAGRFTGGQLTAVIIAVVVAAGLPGAAFAVDAFTKVVVQDPNGQQAHVTNDGRLQVEAQPEGADYRELFTWTYTTGEKDSQQGQGTDFRLSSITIANSGLARAVVRVDFRQSFCSANGLTENVGVFVAAANTTTTIAFPTPWHLGEYDTHSAFCPLTKDFAQVTNLSANLGEVDVILIGTRNPA